MLQIDRSSGIPIHIQLVSRLRYLIVSGQFQKGENLPSTRQLAAQLGISFHTVRKAYQALENSGYLQSTQGSGFRVLSVESSSKSDRMEQGASIIHETLQQLIGLGLDEQEIEYLIQEQSSILETENETYKIVLAGPFREWAYQCGPSLSAEIQQDIVFTTISELKHHADADVVLVPFRYIRTILPEVVQADIVGVQPEIGGETLDAVSRLLERETLGLVTQYADAIGPLTSELRDQTRFGGQILAVAVEHGDAHLPPTLEQCELVLYTEAAWKTSRTLLAKATRSVRLAFALTASSIDRVRQIIPT